MNFKKYLPELMSGKRFVLWMLLAIVLVACSGQREPKQGEISSIHTQVARAMEATRVAQKELLDNKQKTAVAVKALTPTLTITHTPSATELPTLTLTLQPSLTPTETPSPTSTETPTNVNVWGIPENAIVFYLTLLETGGPIGCGDSLIKLSTGRYRTGDLAADLKVALDTLFAAGQYSGGAYNATYPSTLWVDEVNLTSNGSAIVYFSGSYVKPADSCDASRYRSQVWATALQFEEIERFEPYVGNSLLGDRLAVYSDSGK